MIGSLPKFTENSQKIDFCLGLECSAPKNDLEEPETKQGCQTMKTSALLWWIPIVFGGYRSLTVKCRDVHPLEIVLLVKVFVWSEEVCRSVILEHNMVVMTCRGSRIEQFYLWSVQTPNYWTMIHIYRPHTTEFGSRTIDRRSMNTSKTLFFCNSLVTYHDQTIETRGM